MGSQDALQRLRKKTRVFGEMVLPTLFLLTGIGLAVNSPYGSDLWLWLKLALVGLSVFTGIMTFRKNSKGMGLLTLGIFIYIVMLSYRKSPDLKRHIPGETSQINNSTEMAEPPAAENTVEGKTTVNADPVMRGQAAFLRIGCIACHGSDGAKRLSGAANLQTSRLSDDMIHDRILNGKNAMMPYKEALHGTDLEDLTAYVKSLRK